MKAEKGTQMYKLINIYRAKKRDREFKKIVKEFEALMEYAHKMANYEIPADKPLPNNK